MKSMTELQQDVSKCTRCGNCQYYCPTFSVSRLETHVARGRLQLVKRSLESEGEFSDSFRKRLNQCLLCGNCSQNCPPGISIEDIVERTREMGVGQAGPPQGMALAAKNIADVGNITGDSRENRLLWLENMAPGSVKVGGKAEVVYFAGCVPTLYPSSYSIPQTFSGLLNKAGLDWAVMGESENCCAYPLLIGGMREDAIKVMEQNARDLAALGARRLVTTCPSCYHMWKEIYPKYVAVMPEVEVLHETQLVAELIKKGAFQFKEMAGTVTYHDSCDLGRKSGVYDVPREVLSAIPGVKLVEMKFNKENAYCCGGGGNLEMNDTALSGKVAQQRIAQALDTGADVIVTSCQQCKRTLANGARQKRARIKIVDVSELVSSAIV